MYKDIDQIKLHRNRSYCNRWIAVKSDDVQGKNFSSTREDVELYVANTVQVQKKVTPIQLVVTMNKHDGWCAGDWICQKTTTTTTTTKKHQRKSGKNQADINSILLPYFPELSTLNIPAGWFYKLSWQSKFRETKFLTCKKVLMNRESSMWGLLPQV